MGRRVLPLGRHCVRVDICRWGKGKAEHNRISHSINSPSNYSLTQSPMQSLSHPLTLTPSFLIPPLPFSPFSIPGGTLLEAQPGAMVHRICLPDELFTHSQTIDSNNNNNNHHHKISARFVAIFHGNSDSLVATSASQLTSRWSLCNLHRPLTTDFVFFEIEGNNVTLCTSEIAPIVPDLPYALMSSRALARQLREQQQPQPQQLQSQLHTSVVQPVSIQPSVWAEPMNPQRPLRMGVFTTHTSTNTHTKSGGGGAGGRGGGADGGGGGAGGGGGGGSKWEGTGYALTSRMYEGTPVEEHDILIANGTLPGGVGR